MTKTETQNTPNPNEKPNPGFNHRLVFGLFIAVLVIAGIFLRSFLIDVGLLVFAAILMAVILRIPGDWMHKITKIPQRWASLISLLVVLSLFILFGVFLTPKISGQIEKITQQIPQLMRGIRSNLQQVPWALQWMERVKDVPDMITEVKGVGNILAQISGIFSGAFGFIANLTIFFVLSVYFAYEPRNYVDGLVRLFPPQHRERTLEVVMEIGDALKWWLIGRVIAMFILGTLVGIGLAIIGVPLSLSLGIITGLLSFVPIIGGVIAFVPAGFVALAESPLMLFYVFLLYMGAQAVENYLLTPIVQRQTVSLAPAIALIIQLTMGIIAGPFGIALAYPVAVVGQVMVNELYIKDMLEGDPQFT
ncbi:MAG: AI-2E family transporter [Anaerolineales bacterium]